jgi:hypothetical protein
MSLLEARTNVEMPRMELQQQPVLDGYAGALSLVALQQIVVTMMKSCSWHWLYQAVKQQRWQQSLQQH